MSPRSVLAIDAGQTAIKVRLDTPGHRDDLLFRGIDTHEPLLPQLADVVREAVERTHGSPTLLTAGISGLTERDSDAGALLSLLSGTGIRGARLAHDSTTSFLGALGSRSGAVVAAGTGVVTLAVGLHSVARVDGWGYIMGDAGSGYWIGRAALDASMRAYDGRGPATGLVDVVRERWPDLAQAYIALQSDDDRVRIVAAFAADVAALASDGDEVALRITAEAAHELATSVSTAIGRVRDRDETFAVCAVGGVFGSALLRDAFAEELSGPGIELVTPLGTAIDGAVALAELAPTHPLTADVRHAGTV
ncbi:N-acetylglucosamine kinase [Microbacterium terricola]|uniref:ATPase n=1 Tax=Microbacterium terricola TaxID=344163 RepID=A0ABM8DWC4_9MICO|nr:BadF/BadG/BcrA/BcrD ATPase family protein [Microbacterium terricola]UYK39355.1 hypothetical protein OAU46_11680 [Microbacterium terricola]BDV29921.1 ATPase [Microbacterium terricola]